MANPALLDAISGFGLALMPIPEALGGVAMPRSPLSNALAVEDLAQGDMSHTLAALQPMAAVNALMDFGDEQQQERWLPALAAETFTGAALAVNEPRATFEPAAPATMASKDGGIYTLNGVKSLVPMAAQCEWFVVVAAIDGEVAGFVVPAEAEGLSIESESYMGLRSANMATLTLENVAVPARDRLPGFDLNRLLGLSRIGQCALAVGCCQAVMEYSIPYVKERKAFGKPVAAFQNTQFKIAEMHTKLEVARAYVDRCLELHLKKELDIPTAAAAKYYITDLQCEVIDECVQLHGGYGYMWEYPVARMFADSRVQRIYGGTNEIMKTIIAKAVLAD
jgi:alkylation response protein AidB-like acyl-CoA dehydrogenase